MMVWRNSRIRQPPRSGSVGFIFIDRQSLESPPLYWIRWTIKLSSSMTRSLFARSSYPQFENPLNQAFFFHSWFVSDIYLFSSIRITQAQRSQQILSCDIHRRRQPEQTQPRRRSSLRKGLEVPMWGQIYSVFLMLSSQDRYLQYILCDVISYLSHGSQVP